MTRLPDWETRLWAGIEAARRRPFVWGGHDCCMFACDLLSAMTGVDPGAAFRGTYSDKAGAKAVLKRLYRGGLERTISAIAGEVAAPEISPRLARRGDCCFLWIENGGPAMGVCVGAQAAVAALSGGVAFLPMRQVLRAWRVG